MSPHILYVKIHGHIPWQVTLKERRSIAQKMRDGIKNSFNASVKLDYGKQSQTFDLYCICLGESKPYLEGQIETLYKKIEGLVDFECKIDSQIELW